MFMMLITTNVSVIFAARHQLTEALVMGQVFFFWGALGRLCRPTLRLVVFCFYIQFSNLDLGSEEIYWKRDKEPIQE